MDKSEVLIKMGYKPEIIALAMEESANKSLEELVDLLQFRSKHYQRVLKRKQEQGIQPEFKKTYSIQKDQSNFDPVGNNIDLKSKTYAQKLITELKMPSFDDPKYYINRLLRVFDTIKNDTTPENQTLQKYILAQQWRFPQVSELKNGVCTVLSKILTMKVKNDVVVETDKLEEAILKAFEMRLMNAKQMDSVIGFYNKFCERMSLPVDDELVEKLEKHTSDTLNYRPPGWSFEESDDSFEVIRESDVPVYMEDEPVIVDMDCCTVCMENVKEITFLPCQHFITCPLCSPGVTKCPMCTKEAQGHVAAR